MVCKRVTIYTLSCWQMLKQLCVWGLRNFMSHSQKQLIVRI